MASLRLSSQGNSETFSIDSNELVMGRQPECDLCRPFAGNQRISRKHSRVFLRGGQYFLEDLGSRNGTRLNAELVESVRALQSGDRIELGGVTLEFISEANPAPAHTIDAPLGDSDHEQSIIVSTASLFGDDEDDDPKQTERKLHGLIALLGKLGNSLSVDEILDNLISGLFLVFPQADSGFVGLKTEDDKVVAKVARHRDGKSDDTVLVSRTVVNRVMESKEAILSVDAQSDVRLNTSESIHASEIRSFMCAPLLDAAGEAIGVIQLDALDYRKRFEPLDLQVFASISPQAAIAMQFADLHNAALKQQALDRDLEVAHQVQTALLPPLSPEIDGYNFFAYYQTAYQVGGDLYDYIALEDGRWAIVVADAAGKGVSAAMMMANLSGELRTFFRYEDDVAKAVARVNVSLCENGVPGRFVTMLLAVIDAKSHTAQIVNAGHMEPLFCHADGSVEKITGNQRGPAIGIMPTIDYEPCSISLLPGDTVVMFTDGFNEAENAEQEFYGLERLEARLQDAAGITNLGAHLLEDVEAFVGGHPQSDDMCLVSFGRDR
ncbi:MAG: SpoIIE family protein phosphatase [Pirellulales bacterium]|nr:SpoIIE family protein phosphatase [Pirellulales bacterium]